MYIFKNLISDLVSLLFPRLCCACETPLFKTELDICLHCLHGLPFTDFHLYPDNRVAKQFWGRVPLQSAMAMLYFKKGNRVQQLIYQLKYKGQTGLGVQLGEMIGSRLMSNPDFQCDLIIPIPLHRSKAAQRGYNQSFFIAKGISLVIHVPVISTTLLKMKKTGSQTRRGRFSRYENLLGAFIVVNSDTIKNRNILLVDDVVTTGATLEACAGMLLTNGAKSVSVAAIAFSD